MRKFLLLLLAAPCLASGPKYDYADIAPKLDDEINNIYADIKNVANGKYKASSMTLQGLTVDSITINSSQGGITVGKYKQLVSSTSLTLFNTTSSSFQNSNLAATIVPTSASSRIKVTVSATVRNSNGAAANMAVSLYRGATDLGGGGSGGFYQQNFTGWTNCAFSYVDSPATVSGVTYVAKIRNDDNATTVSFGANSISATTTQQSIVLEEIP